MSKEITIEKNVPIPERYTRSPIPPLPLDEMEIGDSFVLKLDGDMKTAQGTVRQRIHRYQKSNVPKRFSMQTVDDQTVRIFRVKDETDEDRWRKML